jgi:hypothetical protein
MLPDAIADKSAVSALDKGLQAGEAKYQADRAATGSTGFDLPRIGGNILSPINFAAPEISGVGRLAPLARLAGSVATGGALGGLEPVTNGGQDFANQKAKQVGLGMVGGAIAPGLGAVLKGGGKLIPAVLGQSTGAGANSIRGAFEAGAAGGEAGQAFRASMRGETPWAQVVDDAKDALSNMRVQRNAAYRSGMSDISKDATVLSFEPVDAAMAKTASVKSFKGQDLAPKTADVRKEVDDAIAEWKALDPAEFHTPEGFDALKQKIGDIAESLPYNTPQRVVADNAYSAVKKAISQQAPAYDKVMADYSTASDQIKQIQKELSLNPKANINTALRKLQSVMRDNVNTSWGDRAKYADTLAKSGASNLLPSLAGQALSSSLPRGLKAPVLDSMIASAAGLMNPGTLALLPMASPRIVGEAAHMAGRAVGGVNAAQLATRGALPVLNGIRLPPGLFGAGFPQLLEQPSVQGAR